VILLWGVPGDDPLDVVQEALARRGADARLLDQRDIYEVARAETGLAETVAVTDGQIDLADVGAAYIRPQESLERSREADASLVAWADLTGAEVVNRPTAMAANNSKPYQLALIGRYGFEVPDTLVTTDASEALRFQRRHRQVVYKSVSGVRSIVSQLRDEQLERLADVANGPTQFQEWVPGEDVRVHVVGGEVLATLIRSDADDYRYASRDGSKIELTRTTLPADIAHRCRAAARGMGLHVAGIDLRTTHGRWTCLEVNPSPAFTFYEAATGQPIADAIALLLTRLDCARARGRVADSRR
jgi:glutathione synthase/RimK-type ligase-like ATP-grasp enzyme